MARRATFAGVKINWRDAFRIEPEPAPGEAARPRNPLAYVSVAAALLAYVVAEVWGHTAVAIVAPLGLVSVALGAIAMYRANRYKLQGGGLALLAMVAGAVAVLITFRS